MRIPRSAFVCALLSGLVPLQANAQDFEYGESAGGYQYFSATPLENKPAKVQVSVNAKTESLMVENTDEPSPVVANESLPVCYASCQTTAAPKRWNFGGHTQLGYYTDNVPLSQSRNDLLSFQDVPDQVQLNQQWMYSERVASQNGDWGIGGRIDAIYGVDAQKMQAFGNPGAGVRNNGSFDASWDHGIYGWALPQLYGEVANDVLSVKVGHFFTPLGYEVLPSSGNFFYTHSYTMFNSEPFTHTGVLSTYKGVEGLTFYGGWTLGWDTGFDQLNQGNLYLGGVSAQLTEHANLTYMSTYGNFGWRDGGDDNSYSHTIVLQTKLTDRMDYVAQSDLVRTSNPGVSTYDTIGLNQYLFYGLTDRTKLGTRVEWWKADGVSFYEVSNGINYSVAKSFVVRPEYRKDWSPGIGLDTDVFAMDAILKY